MIMIKEEINQLSNMNGGRNDSSRDSFGIERLRGEMIRNNSDSQIINQLDDDSSSCSLEAFDSQDEGGGESFKIQCENGNNQLQIRRHQQMQHKRLDDYDATGQNQQRFSYKLEHENEIQQIDGSSSNQDQAKPQQQSQSSQQYQQQSSQQQLSAHDSDGRPKRNPYCSRCRNHGKSAQVKGHKRHCEYRDCQCEGCKLVECRQIVSAAQIKRRRYQKQDEECGRRIEISPPVLTREPNNDPAALIAKTLIGSANKHSAQRQLAAAVSSAVAGHQQQQQHRVGQTTSHQVLQQMAPQSVMHSAAAATFAAAAAAAANSVASSSAASTPTAGGAGSGSLNQMSSNPPGACNDPTRAQHFVSGPAASSSSTVAALHSSGAHQLAASLATLNRHHQHTNHHHHHHHLQHNPNNPISHHNYQQQQQRLLAASGATATDPAAAAAALGSALDEALHLFHFPDSLLSAAASSLASTGHAHHQHPRAHLGGMAAAAAAAAAATAGLHPLALAPLGSSGAAAAFGAAAAAAASTAASNDNNNNPASSPPSPSSSPPPLISIREQFGLVEEIHQQFGPLAIYAWLRAEQFNLAKVRALIELAKDELLQTNGHTGAPLDLTSPIVD